MNNSAAMDAAQGGITNGRPLAIVATGLVTGVGLDSRGEFSGNHAQEASPRFRVG